MEYFPFIPEEIQKKIIRHADEDSVGVMRRLKKVSKDTRKKVKDSSRVVHVEVTEAMIDANQEALTALLVNPLPLPTTFSIVAAKEYARNRKFFEETLFDYPELHEQLQRILKSMDNIEAPYNLVITLFPSNLAAMPELPLSITSQVRIVSLQWGKVPHMTPPMRQLPCVLLNGGIYGRLIELVASDFCFLPYYRNVPPATRIRELHLEVVNPMYFKFYEQTFPFLQILRIRFTGRVLTNLPKHVPNIWVTCSRDKQLQFMKDDPSERLMAQVIAEENAFEFSADDDEAVAPPPPNPNTIALRKLMITDATFENANTYVPDAYFDNLTELGLVRCMFGDEEHYERFLEMFPETVEIAEEDNVFEFTHTKKK